MGEAGDDGMSVAEVVRSRMGLLTATERRAAHALIAHYPTAGLAPVAEFAERAGVSAPTVLRFVAKLGHASYPDFQKRLRAELEAQLASPLAKAAPGPDPSGGSLIDRFARATADNLAQTWRHLPQAEIEAVVGLLADPRRPVWLLGGRFTDALARYMAAHLALIRPNVLHLPGQAGALSDRLIDLDRRNVVVAFDVRRYQDQVIAFSRAAAGRGAALVLVTDQWLSPIARHAAHVLAGRIAAPSRWDSNVALLAIVDLLLAAVTERLGVRATARIEALEKLRDPDP